jgi:hypothetical protein
MVHKTTRHLQPSKIIALAFSVSMFTGCASTDINYIQYLEQTHRLSASQNAAEAACLLVLAEGIKQGDNQTKTMLASQIDKCKKEPIKIMPPKNWLGL